jgi:hypothetical protein
MGRRIRTFVLPGLVFAATWLAPGRGHAYLTLHWDACDSYAIDKSFTGPGVYRQIVSVWGLDAPMRGYSIRIRATMSNVYDQPYEPPADAWRFDAAGCNAGGATAGAAVQPCPDLGSGASVAVTYDGQAVYVTVSATHELFDPAPNVQYILGRIDYDHSGSAAGPHDPAVACGYAELPACFVIDQATWFDAQNVAHPLDFEFFSGVAWQGWGHCFGDLPVQPAHWSVVKSLYK